ncbi:ATP-binding protein [Paucibacter sp. R3-3]|uniref:ATP-binding protein n=1 Tax=Roseateles agri TaxID=3098619 RepID=A0ABU5DFN8_9BURK|nr:RNA-binding domain-containing protein [Paucibacter sp. R3-3]MDY0745100.1 ATP-binding protein [Paucibacter sp. R3-3]
MASDGIPTDEELLILLARLEHEPADALESQWLDFKPWHEPKQELKVACEYAACFANAQGGVIVFGVADKVRGREVAIHGAQGFDLDLFRRGIYEGTRPALSVSATVLPVAEGTGQLLVIRVPKGDMGPYGTSAGLFKQREGKNCMPLDPRGFARARVSTGEVDWSGAAATGVGIGDLDPVQMARARNVLRTKDPASGLLDLTDADFLAGLEAVRDGQVTHTGLLLFGRRDVLARSCPQAQFHYVLLRDETTVARNDIDRLPLLEIVERMEQVFQGPLNPEEEIALGLFKLRIPQFPLEAVREAVLNALTHRDYLDPGEVLVRHSVDELVVTSPGGFIAGISPENILRHEPKARNRTLANAFVKLRLVESSGIGRRRIYRSALEFGKRRPAYSASSEAVTLRIFNRGANPRLARMVSELGAAGAPISLDHLLVLDALLQKDHIDTAAAAEVLQMNRDDARLVLDAMTAATLGLLERRGHTQTATFHLAKGVATGLKGKAAYTRTRGLNPVRYAEMVREYLKDHRFITNAELRQLLGLGGSASASVEASRLLGKWCGDDGFLQKHPPENRPRYSLKDSQA